MKKLNRMTQILAVAGTVLLWLPVLAMFVFTIPGALKGSLNFDFLIPAEVFPVELVGGGLLLWAALRARSQRALIGGALGGAGVILAAGLLLAQVSGVASNPAGTYPVLEALVLGAVALYDLGLVAAGVGGIRLIRELFTPRRTEG